MSKKEKNSTVNMTEGSELGHILRFTIPLLAGNLFQQLYNIVDTIIVGKYLGYNALASVGSTGSLTFFFNALCIGLAAGSGILISQSFGADNHDRAKTYIINSGYVLAVIGAIISIIAVCLARSILQLMDTPGNAIDNATIYMRTVCGGVVCVAIYNWINVVLRSLGDSKTPLIFLMVASVLNAILDITFIIGLHMGVRGAALATVIAQGVSAASCIIWAFKRNSYFKFKAEHIRASFKHMLDCVKTGIPLSLQNSFVSISMIYLQRTANLFGDVVMAAYTSTMRVEQIIQQPFSSLGLALSTFTGQNVGAGKKERVDVGYKKTMKTMVIFSLAMLLVFMVCSPLIINIFVDNKKVISIGAKALRISCLFYIPLGTIHTTRGLLNGAGDVNFALLNGIVEVVCRIIFATLLIRIPFIGEWGIWLTSCFTWLLTGVFTIWRYNSGVWEKRL